MKSIPTVYELRKKGWKVRVGHHRKYFRYDPFTGRKQEVCALREEHEEKYPDFYLKAMGGVTTVGILVPGYDRDFVGVSECSDKEHYRKHTGVKKALARALSALAQEQNNQGN